MENGLHTQLLANQGGKLRVKAGKFTVFIGVIHGLVYGVADDHIAFFLDVGQVAVRGSFRSRGFFSGSFFRRGFFRSSLFRRGFLGRRLCSRLGAAKGRQGKHHKGKGKS